MTESKPVSKTAFFRQLALALCSSVGFLATGLIRGYSSPALPSFNETSPHILQDPNDKYWFVAVPPLGSVVGCLVAMPWMHWMGRKRVIQFVAVFFTLSWVGLATADSAAVIIFFRACNGVAGGVTVPAVQVYVSECSDTRVRGLVASLPSVLMVLGVLVQYLLGIALSWRGMAWFSATFPCILALLLIPFPESPPWLRLTARSTNRQAYTWLGLRPDTDQEASPMSPEAQEPPPRPPFCSRGVMVPLSLAFSMIIFQQTCGNDIITYNTVSLFKTCSSDIDGFWASFVFAVVHFVFVVLSIFLIDRLGRRPLLMISAFLMGISMLCLSAYFRLCDRLGERPSAYYLLASVLMYIASYSLGFCTVPLVLFGEILPLSYRSLLGPLTMCLGVLAMFLELITFPMLDHAIGKDFTFALYAFFNFFAVGFTFFLLPETKGKSLEEIEVYFSKGKFR